MKLSDVGGARIPMLSVLCASFVFGGAVLALPLRASSQSIDVVVCDDKEGKHLQPGSATTDLEVTGPCEVKAGGTYIYRNVNIYADPKHNPTLNPALDHPGALSFTDPPKGVNTDFYAESIIIERDGSLIAGEPTKPIGRNGGTVAIHLWGRESDSGAICKTDDRCGVPLALWNSNSPPTPASCNAMEIDPHIETGDPGRTGLLGLGRPRVTGGHLINRQKLTDCFYEYDKLDDTDQDARAYFGHKVLALSYGGTLELYGEKGAIYNGREAKGACKETDDSCTGTSWVRLNGTIQPGDAVRELKVDGDVGWAEGDHIVVTTTDYLPSHSEELIISEKPTVTGQVTTIKYKNADGVTPGVRWPHNGETYDLSKLPARLGIARTSADTRAAVALLTRSIRIVSDGDKPKDPFAATPGNFFGGHTIVRQGFESYQIQGVQFRQLGQGGRIMHYPIHFHLARRVPQSSEKPQIPITFVKDSSIDDSMTRWITIHATQGVTLARNVGYLSIGHGFYLEDGTETDNKLFANLGILARAAVDNAQNPRQVPGILTTTTPQQENPLAPGFNNFPYYSDSDHPAVFWIMNGWNDFHYNMAAGAGTCGACYWLVPGAISGPSQKQKWYGYAGEQRGLGRAGLTPLKEFIGNSCSSAMTAFTVVGNTAACNGVNQIPLDRVKPKTTLRMLPSAAATKAYTYNDKNQRVVDPNYWPMVGGGGRRATRCKAADDNSDQPFDDESDCSTDDTARQCSNGAGEENCDATVVEKFTTSFNWAQKNLAAVWMRPFWSLVNESVVTDVQNAGVNFVTSGDYSKASVINGFWAVARKTAFVGSTQIDNPLASNAGPFNPFVSKKYKGLNGKSEVVPLTGLSCAVDPASGGYNPQYCLSHDDGVAMQLDSFSNFQRFFSVYDGPAYQESNAYLNIHPTYLTGDGTAAGKVLDVCQPHPSNPEIGNPCVNSGFMNGGQAGLLADTSNKRCYLPNAGIGWKQPNGFYYAPAFHSVNLYFDSVDIRHFVTEPLFKLGENDYFDTDVDALKERYCYFGTNSRGGTFNGFTDIDRETVLNDDDGTLTGLTSQIRGAGRKAETISVNKEAFFDAPIESPECASDVALNKTSDPRCAPNTAKTSPYEYVTTALFPECALSVPDSDADLRVCKDENWGSNCATSDDTQNNNCVGVPLFRQLLVKDEAEGPDQEKRMMGQNTFQRSGLTVNHGSYYIDTTVSKARQQAQRAKSLNVFRGFQQSDTPGDRPFGVYDLFFLYAKKTTAQTYTFWVGDAPSNFGDTNVKFGYVDISTAKYTFEPTGTWPKGWVSSYADGILTLKVNMAYLADDFDLTKNDPATGKPVGEGLCQPKTMCGWDKAAAKCKCTIKDPNNYLYRACNENNAAGDDAICSWGVKDLDCPAKGCPALQITFPKDFHADDDKNHHRPTPDRFSTDPTMFDWDVSFNLEDDAIAGKQCHYTKQPAEQCAMVSVP